MTNIGLFGGTFDPIHRGHLQCAAAARIEGGVDSVVFIPSALPPHKNGESISGFNHRLAMLNRAVAEYDQFSVSDIEGHRSTPSYTIDTLNFFCNRGKSSGAYHFIIGGDAFLEIESWYRWQTVLSRTDFIIIIRPGYNTARLHELLENVNFTMEETSQNLWLNTFGTNSIRILKTQTDDISSSDIKHRIKTNMSWRHLVPDNVADYIDEHALYC